MIASDQGKYRQRWWAAGGCRFVLAWLALGVLLALPQPMQAQARRLVILKVDGLSDDMVEHFVHERDPRTGKSLLPWFGHVFYEGGTRVANFYTRGMSLSGPSWSLLDTGQHLQIKGNVEFDRYTLHSYDYLNFIPFWLEQAGQRRVDMPGPEVLDEVGVPLLLDRYPYDERHQSFQLYQRGARWTTLERGLKHRFTSQPPRELFDEWVTGFEVRDIVAGQLEREVLGKLQDSRVRYLDVYSGSFDHATHHNRDRATHLAALQEIDALVGRLWTAIQHSPLAAETALVVVSDHGTNTDERTYSQGYNLVKLLGSAAGGGHHVITKRRLLNDYALKGIYPLVPVITTTTPDSYYLKGQSTDYQTALLDFDGNERASIHLRDSDLNVLHILLGELQSGKLTPPLARAATDAFFATLERRRPEWQRTLDELRAEIGALQRLVARQRALVAAQPKQWTKADRDAGRDQDARREFARMDASAGDVRTYTEYARTLGNLLALRRAAFAPNALRIPDVIAKHAMGEANTLRELQHYVVGPAPGGLALDASGVLDADKSFTRVDYLALLRSVAVRNNVQPAVDDHPVDFVAARLQPEALRGLAADNDLRADEAFWLYKDGNTQALVLARDGRGGQLRLRYLPVANLRQEADGSLRFTRAAWRAGLPLNMWEDARVVTPAGAPREEWLADWHTDLEWLRALHRSAYSNGLVGLHEQLARHRAPALAADVPGLSADEQLIRRMRRRQRALVETDLLVLANNHWNFDVRGFNPGGNHGSFFRVSTHSLLLLAGGAHTNVPHGLTIEEPYDSLSFVPTMLTLTGEFEANAARPSLVDFSPDVSLFPGRVINELFNNSAPAPISGASARGVTPGRTGKPAADPPTGGTP